jgi:hypothetical protein
MPNIPKTPPRTLGIVLAIALGIVLYVLLPFIFVGFTLRLQANTRSSEVIIGGDGTTFIGGGMGFVSVMPWELALWGIGALAFLIVASLTWHGKPPQMRLIYTGAVILMPLWFGGLWMYRTYRDNQFLQQSGAIVPTPPIFSICQGGVVLPILVVTLYNVWYMNRGPARAFFRGYYLEHPAEQRDARRSDKAG